MTKLCVDCKHYERDADRHMCVIRRSIVTGDPLPVECEWHREDCFSYNQQMGAKADPPRCGIGAKYFEAKA